eukprot:5435801-Amphidinium_carterae.1
MRNLKRLASKKALWCSGVYTCLCVPVCLCLGNYRGCVPCGSKTIAQTVMLVDLDAPEGGFNMDGSVALA